MSDVFASSEPAEKRTLLSYLLQNPTVSGKKLEFSLRKPFDTILELGNRPTWLPSMDTFRTPDWAKVIADFGTLSRLVLTSIPRTVAE